MAEGFAREFGKGLIGVYSAGLFAAGVHRRAIAVMNEIGIDISKQKSKEINEDLLKQMNIIVTLCGNAIETGTLNHASLAGVNAAVNYIASFAEGTNLRSALLSAMKRIGTHERQLALRLYNELQSLPGVTVRGPSFQAPQGAPTVSFTMDGMKPEQLCASLAQEGIFAWDGHFYAIRPMEVLGLLERGGVTRLGISLYTTDEEIDRLLAVLGSLARPAS